MLSSTSSTTLFNTWSKLTRFQHHARFLQHCVRQNIIPKGLNFKFNLALNADNPELQQFCKEILTNTSKSILQELTKSVTAKVTELHKDLERNKIQLFQLSDEENPQSTWIYVKRKMAELRRKLSIREKKKLSGITSIPSPSIGSPSNVVGPKKRKARRFSRDYRRTRYTRARSNTNTDAEMEQHLPVDSDLQPINISSSTITTDQIKLLSKGPKFCPHPKDINWLKVQDDLDKFARKLRITYLLKNKIQQPNKDKGNFPVPRTSSWDPHTSCHELELFISKVNRDILNPKNTRKVQDNLSKGERLALKEFKTNHEIAIRLQDKGSRFVLIDLLDYEEKMLEQLNNPLHYKSLAADLSIESTNLVTDWSNKRLSRKQITPELAKWVVNQDAKPGTAFGNIKTHKEGYPLRLITSCRNTAIERISSFSEFYLKPLTEKLPSFIKDTSHLLHKINEINLAGPLPPDTLLVSWDVVAMFPNIDNNLGMSAVKRALDSREVKYPATECIVEATEICLKHNNSTFNNHNFLQIHGTAMGPKNACSYADLAMGEIDNLAHKWHLKPFWWGRYRDDIIDFWPHGEEKLLEFTNYINSLYPTIRFELVYSKTRLNVLDLTLHLKDGYVQSDIYSKPTDSHLYLPYSSSHPSHCKKAIPYGVALRLKRNCSTQEFLSKRIPEYQNYLYRQGYSQREVTTSFNKALEMPSSNNAEEVHNNKKKMLPLVVDFNPLLPDIGKIIRKHMPILNSSPILGEIFNDNSIIPAFRRRKNLKELLAPSKSHSSASENSFIEDVPGCFKCDKKCDLCQNYLKESNTFSSFETGKSYRIRQKLTCTSSHLIYLISCNKCKLQYVGSTATAFKTRFRNHKSSMITNKKTCEVAIHFNSLTHSLTDFDFICIEGIRNVESSHSTEQILLTREAYWSAQLFTLYPNGLNKRKEFRSKNRIHFNNN